MGSGPASAAELAVHFERGRDYPWAARYMQQAADNALSAMHITKP
jgi:HEPN domain-containing protein